MNLFIFITFCTFLATGTPQYYYIGQPAVFHIPTPYNTFSHPLPTYHVNPHFQQFRTVPAQIPSPALPAPAPAPRTSFVQNHDAEYRGFAYHTRTDNGATSHVLFVTGPQAQQVNSRVFNNFNSPVFEQNNQARTFASEMIDPIKKSEPEEEKQNDLPKNIQDLYTPPPMEKVENNDPFQYFRSVFQNHQNPANHLINFYSKNTDLFAQQVPGYPANVAPLPYYTNTVSHNTSEITQHNETGREIAAESIEIPSRYILNSTADLNNPNIITDEEEIHNNKKDETTFQSSSPTTVILLSSRIKDSGANDDKSASSTTSSHPGDTLPSIISTSTSTSIATTTSASPSVSASESTPVSTSPSVSASESTPLSEYISASEIASALESTTASESAKSASSEDEPESTTTLSAGFAERIQRSGNQPDTRALETFTLNEIPSSSSVLKSKSGIGISPSQSESPDSYSTYGDTGLQTNNSSVMVVQVQNRNDLTSGIIHTWLVSSETVTENVSKSGDTTLKMAGFITSIAAKAKLSSSDPEFDSSSFSNGTAISNLSSSSSESISSTSIGISAKGISSSESSSSSESRQSKSILEQIELEITTETNGKNTVTTNTVDTTRATIQLPQQEANSDKYEEFTSQTTELSTIGNSDSSLVSTTESELATSTIDQTKDEFDTTENISFTTEAMLITTMQ